MSVLVKGMTMPTDCRECVLSKYDNRTGKVWCKPVDGILAEDYKPIMFDGRPEWCPLVELPVEQEDESGRGCQKVSEGRYDG